MPAGGGSGAPIARRAFPSRSSYFLRCEAVQNSSSWRMRHGPISLPQYRQATSVLAQSRIDYNVNFAKKCQRIMAEIVMDLVRIKSLTKVKRCREEVCETGPLQKKLIPFFCLLGLASARQPFTPQDIWLWRTSSD